MIILANNLRLCDNLNTPMKGLKIIPKLPKSIADNYTRFNPCWKIYLKMQWIVKSKTCVYTYS